MISQSEFATAIGDWSLLPADPRFRIYRNNVASALINALRVRYPATERLLGREAFAACAGSYAEVQRPGSPVLIEYGASFPDHLAATSHSDVAADLARLESLWWQAYHAADASPLPPDTLSRIPAERWGLARFAFLPSLGLLSSPHAVGSLWQGQSADGGPQNIVIARPEAEVTLHVLAPAPFMLLSALFKGATLAEAVETTTSGHEDFDLAQTLQGLLALRIITGVAT
jgi:hypothetical protein